MFKADNIKFAIKSLGFFAVLNRFDGWATGKYRPESKVYLDQSHSKSLRDEEIERINRKFFLTYLRDNHATTEEIITIFKKSIPNYFSEAGLLDKLEIFKGLRKTPPGDHPFIERNYPKR